MKRTSKLSAGTPTTQARHCDRCQPNCLRCFHGKYCRRFSRQIIQSTFVLLGDQLSTRTHGTPTVRRRFRLPCRLAWLSWAPKPNATPSFNLSIPATTISVLRSACSSGGPELPPNVLAPAWQLRLAGLCSIGGGTYHPHGSRPRSCCWRWRFRLDTGSKWVATSCTLSFGLF